MGAFETYIDGLKAGTPGVIPFGGMLTPASDENPIALAMQIKGGNFVVPDLDTLANIPYNLLSLGMSVTVMEFVSSGGKVNPRTKYYLFNLPPANTRVSEVSSYLIANYWKIDNNDQTFSAEVEVQYAPNYQSQRPLFLPTQISYDAYQAGYPTTALFIGGNPADIIWKGTFSNDALWIRQRLSGQPWGIPVSISQGNYSQGQYIDVIFLWVNKGDPYPQRPIQPNDPSQLPAGWQDTPGTNYAVQILTQDLYRSQAIRNAYGVLQSDWDLPLLVSTDPQLTRYGDTPGNTDFLNDTYWRGYYTPGLDTFQATRPDAGSSNWTVSKISDESGEFQELVFKEFSIGVQQSDLIAATPTATEPINGVYPNDWQDAPFAPALGNVLYVSQATKFNDGSLKKPWSVPKRFDGLDTIQSIIEETPGDTFYQTRDGSGNLSYAFLTITLTARLYQGPTELTSGITQYNWYYGTTLIIFSSITNQPTNLGLVNTHITASPDRKTLTLDPNAISNTQVFKVGIVHPSRITQYENSIQLFDATDDNTGFVADIIAVSGSTFKNQTGLYQFNSAFFKGGVSDNTGVVFTWSIQDTGGSPLTGALRNSGGGSIGDTNVAAATVYVSGADISQYAVLILTATFGAVVRTSRITLTDVGDALAMEALYWGTGSVDPGPPTDFMPRTLTTAAVLALAIGYSTDATGRWYMIQRIDGVWSGPIQMRAESARPNGGINLLIYKNVQLSLGAPVAPSVPGSGSIIPAGWTATPTAFSGLEDATFLSSLMFLLRTDVTADPTVLTRDNYNPTSGTFGTPVRITGIDGTNSSPGINGTNGWSPVFAIVNNTLGGKVIQLVDWVGGTGSKPAAGGTVSYVGASGLTTIDAAIDIQGPAGSSATVPPAYYNLVGSKTGSPTTPIAAGASEVLVQSMNIINTWSSARNFLIIADLGVRSQDSFDEFIFTLCVRNAANDPTSLSLRGDPPFGANSVVDQTVVTVAADINPAGGVGNKLRVMGVISIPAGATFGVIVSLRTLVGAGGHYGPGSIIAIGV